MSDLSSFIRNLVNISDEDLAKINDQFAAQKVSKGSILLREDQRVSELFFVSTGCLRLYHEVVERTHDDITLWIATAPAFFGELNSFATDQVARHNIEAIEDSEVLTIRKTQVDTLMRDIPPFNTFLLKIWQRAFQGISERTMLHQTTDSLGKYQWLEENYDLLNRVPHKYLASYLGITPSSLSRIRRKRQRSV